MDGGLTRAGFLPPGAPGDRSVLEAPLRGRKHCLYALICALWILPGLVGRAPWHPAELFLTPMAAEMADGGLRWMPLLLGEPFLEHPPLYIWLAAASAKVFAFLPAHEGARLINIPLLAAGFLFLYLCGSRKYGAKTGWLSVLLALGAAGFMIRAHLLEPGVAAFAGAGALLWGALILKTHALVGGAVCGLAVGFLFLSAGVAPAFAAVLFLLLLVMRRRSRGGVAGLVVALAVALPLLLLWPAVLAQRQPEVFQLWLSAALPSFSPSNILRMPLLFAWALFPALPIAAAGLFMSRRKRQTFGGDDELFAALLFFVLAALSILWGGGADEEDLFFALPALALAAARFMQKLPDDAAVVLDWFALLVVGVFCAGAAWVLWLCLVFGAPEFAVSYMAETFPGFELPPPSPFAVAAAIFVTALWCALIANFGRSNERAVVNWSCGVTVVWLIFNALWLGYADSAKSYQKPALEIRAALDGGCVAKTRGGAPARMLAQLSYWGAQVGGDECAFALERAGEGKGGAALWSGGRAGKTKYRLYQVE